MSDFSSDSDIVVEFSSDIDKDGVGWWSGEGEVSLKLGDLGYSMAHADKWYCEETEVNEVLIFMAEILTGIFCENERNQNNITL